MSARCTISVLADGMSSPGFDDVGRQQEIVGALVEGGHHGFELGRRHPAMRHGDADLGHHLAQFLAHLVEIGDARRDIEDLPAAVALPQDRLAHHHRIERRHEGAHRQPVDRRRGDDAHLAHAGERQLQGARDRRRGQGQHMHVGLQLLQPLLLGDAEMLLLVDDDEAEMGETHILGEERVGADDDLDPAGGKFVLGLLRLLGRDQARQLRDTHRQPGETLAEAAVVLARQQGRRHDDRDLPAGKRGDEGGAQRDLGLAEADIAADQPVHRLARRQVAERVLDRAQLVLGLGIGKARGELLVKALGRDQRLARMQLALGGDADELAGDLADALLDPRLARLPGDAAEPVELRPGLLGAVARQHLDILDRHEQAVVAGIEHLQAIVRRAGDTDRLQRLVAADAVLGMDDEVARREARRLGDEIVEVAAPARRARQPVAEDVLLAEQHQRLGGKALFERQDGEPDRGFGQFCERVAVGDPAQIAEPALAQHRGEPVGRALAIGRDRGAPAGFMLGVEIVAHRVEQLHLGVGAFGGKTLCRPRPGIDGVAVGLGCGEGRELHHRASRQLGLPLGVGDEHLIGLDRTIERRGAAAHRRQALPRGVEIGDRLQPMRARLLALPIERHRRPRQVVEQRLQGLVIERQPMLHPGLAPPGADRFVERVVAADIAEELAVAAAEALDRHVVEQHLADRPQHETVEGAGRALAQRIEAAQAFERVAEKIEADRLRRAGRVEIDDAAAHRELAGLAHRVGAEIPVVAEKALQPVERDASARPQGQDAPVEEAPRRHPLHQRVDRGQHDQRPRASSPPPASRVSVSMRRLVISPLGDTRSYGRQSQAGKVSTVSPG